jgi:predicted TIM-barrel fold metal-dependent hydrolase
MYSVALLSTFILLLSSITSGSPNSCHSDWYLTDTHIHAIPSGYAAALAKAGGDPSGFPTPEWSVNGTFESLAVTDSARAVLSISAPGIPIAGRGLTARKLCRETNNQLADMVKKHPGRLDFFGALPDWRDVEGTIEEIDYLYTTQKTAVGVDFYTTYGDHLPGDPMFKPIWEKLESVGALAFMHPTTVEIKPYLISGFLPQPIIDYPQQTTRAAMDLILRGVRSQTPSVDIILAHAGGTLPYVAQRAWGSLQVPQIANETTVDASEAKAQIRRYYYDTALSNTPTQLKGLLENTDSSHILLGTDYPYAPRKHIAAGFAEYLAFSKEHPEISPKVLTRNAKELILRRTVAGK